MATVYQIFCEFLTFLLYLKKKESIKEQGDILISKNQALQVLYLKYYLHKLSWIRNLTKYKKI